MLFNSYIFILFFLPVTLIGYFTLNKYAYGRNGLSGIIWLFLMSLWFYGYQKPEYLLLIMISIGVNYGIGILIGRLKRGQQSQNKQKLILTAGIGFNLGLLFYFKYADFFLDSIEDFFGAEWNMEVALPLGISFFTFQQISYIVDCYREKEGLDYHFFEYAAYVTFFPQLVAGPIVMHSELVPQLKQKENKTINFDNMSRGLYAFALGLGKKVLIADTLSKLVAVGFSDIYSLNSGSVIIMMLAYTLQIYFDFSGYCDIALGIGYMFNVELPINFNSPYKAKSISEFWSRWHMTLTRFFTHYVYIPMGGSRKGRIRTYINTLIVFLLSGLWHGANWTFVLWGGLHGLFMTLEKIGKDIGIRLPSGRLGKLLGLCYGALTFLFVNIVWILFRANSIKDWRLIIERLLSGGWEISDQLSEVIKKLVEIRVLENLGLRGLFEQYPLLPLLALLLILLLAVFFLKNTQEKMAEEKYGLRRSLLSIFLIVWCVISLSDVSEFLYFNF
ncbi:MAG: MBOAT family protein [Lachnospiraceae bacterium]|nr:MBOAT family protein [Lachnospiraceae bacterium]